MDPEQRRSHEAMIIDRLAQRIMELEPLLRAMPFSMPEDAEDPMWQALHLRIQELGGIDPSVIETLGLIVKGLSSRLKNE
jgi:hypothetical protein